MGKRIVSAESIARLADEKQDVSSYFTNDGQMMPPLLSEIDPGEEIIDGLIKEATDEQGTDSIP